LYKLKQNSEILGSHNKVTRRYPFYGRIFTPLLLHCMTFLHFI